MGVKFHPHAQVRIIERGVTEAEVIATVKGGAKFSAQFGRTGFRQNLLSMLSGEGNFIPQSGWR